MPKKIDNDTSYLNNPNLKKVGTIHEYTKEQIEEYIKCKKDPCYFAETYIKIVNVDDGLVDFKLYPYQRKLLKAFNKHRYTICKFPRQSGKCVTGDAIITVMDKINGNVFTDNISNIFQGAVKN